jgi:hypothetical protein
VVSDSPHDICLVSGSRSLLSVSRIFGGNLPSNRATLIRASLAELQKPEHVPHVLQNSSGAKKRSAYAVPVLRFRSNLVSLPTFSLKLFLEITKGFGRQKWLCFEPCRSASPTYTDIREVQWPQFVWFAL